MASKEMQFAFEAWGMNNSTKKGFTIVAGKEPIVSVVRGQINKISIGVTVTHTDAFGADPPDAATRPPISVQKGWPFQARTDFDWDVEVDGEEISVLGDPRESTKVKKAREGVRTQFKAEGGSKYLAIHAQSTFAGSGLKLDAPFVEGEGEIVGLGGFSKASEPVKFLCKLEAERAAKQTWPKVPDSLVTAKAYFGLKNEDTLPTQSVKDIETWVKGIKDFNDGALYRVIRDKQVTIHLDGHTSKSGNKDYNKKLAESRIRAVETVLAKNTNLGGGIDIVRAPRNQSKFEEKHDYRVEIYFDKARAEVAMKASEP